MKVSSTGMRTAEPKLARDLAVSSQKRSILLHTTRTRKIQKKYCR